MSTTNVSNAGTRTARAEKAGSPGVLMSVYRFLASLKLAVITIASLAAALCYATMFEARYGRKAVNLHVYNSVGFGILLLFLATNVLCAATIRYPWKRRQIGFLVTHAGLLILIAGSFYGIYYAVEGQAGAGINGEITSFVLFDKDPVIRVQPLAADGRTAKGEYELPFSPGPFFWKDSRTDLLTRKADPFTITANKFYPAAGFKRDYVAAEGGVPVLKLRPLAKPPRMQSPVEVFHDDAERTFAIPAESKGHAMARAGEQMPVKFVFMYSDRPETAEDFLKPPKDPGSKGVARLRYADQAGKTRMHEVRVDDLEVGKAFPLPESDITLSLISSGARQIKNENVLVDYGDNEYRFVQFRMKKGAAFEAVVAGYAGQPMFPSLVSTSAPMRDDASPIRVSYFAPPVLGGEGMGGVLGVVEVLGDAAGKLYTRVFSRDLKPGGSDEPRPAVIRNPPAALPIGDQVQVLGGENMPMTLWLVADSYIPSATLEDFFVPLKVEPSQFEEALDAAEFTMTVDGETKTFWLARLPDLEAVFTKVSFKAGDFQLSYDYQRRDLGFKLRLNNYEIGYAPGTQQPTTFESDVTVTDDARGIAGDRSLISMNHPLTHRHYTFYQHRFLPVRNASTNQLSGNQMSVFQIGYDPGRTLKYTGSLLVVLGAFLQFYLMRSRLFNGFKAQAAKAKARATLAEDSL